MPNSEAARRGQEANSGDNPDDAVKSGDDWGLPTTRSGMARETKIGLALIVVLCGVFGFVLYKKFDQQKQLLATAKSTKEKDRDKEAIKPTGGDDPRTFDPNVSEASAADVDPFMNSTRTAQVSQNASDPFANARGQSEPAEEPQDLSNPPGRGRAPAPPADELEGDPFGDVATAPQPRAARPAPDDFADFEQPSPTAAVERFEPAAEQFEPVDSFEPVAGTTNVAPAPPGDFEDPFGAPAGSGRAPTTPQEEPLVDDGGMQVTGLESAPVDEFAPSRNPPARRTPPATRATARPIDDFGARSPAPPTSLEGEADPFAPATPRPRTVQSLPPAAVPTGPFDPPATRAVGRTAIPSAGMGTLVDARAEVYEVQPNDNFWVISKKKYGTARYFTALARFNAQRTPDPTKLRPGMKVLTPAPQVLETNYPDLFAQKAPAGVPPKAAASAGYYVDANGQPMYRIGSKDTLTDIARAHLGRSSRWIQIYELNRDHLNSPENLQIGSSLRLPLDASSVRVSGSDALRR